MPIVTAPGIDPATASATNGVNRAPRRLAIPARALASWMTTGIPAERAARYAGAAT